jgi:hypothetical protein
LLDWVGIIGFHGAAIHHLNPQGQDGKRKWLQDPCGLG